MFKSDSITIQSEKINKLKNEGLLNLSNKFQFEEIPNITKKDIRPINADEYIPDELSINKWNKVNNIEDIKKLIDNKNHYLIQVKQVLVKPLH